jgi:hypothetical protein
MIYVFYATLTPIWLVLLLIVYWLSTLRADTTARFRILSDEISSQFEGVHDHLRTDHLETMKALKGDSRNEKGPLRIRGRQAWRSFDLAPQVDTQPLTRSDLADIDADDERC